MDKTIARGLGRQMADYLVASDRARCVWVLTRNRDDFDTFWAAYQTWATSWDMLTTISGIIGDESAALSWRCECYAAERERLSEMEALTV